MPPMTKAQALGYAKSDAAVVTGRLRRTRTVNDQPVTDDWRFIKVYVRDAGSWQVVAFQAAAQ
jgi:Domain of unknown function (DUF4440)